MNIKFGSVCSGIEAASMAWKPLGWEASWLAEIEPFPSAVLKHHYPDTPNYGDMTKLPDMVLSGEIEAPDVLVGGTPCQSFSIAGMRKGLDDDRGQLTIKYVELANAIDTIRRRDGKEECIIVWENVPGILNSKDNAFGCFLAALAGGGSEARAPGGGRWANAGYVLGPERAVAFRVLDAQFFGLAQRRKRVFVIASAREGFCPAKVLFEFDGVRRDIAPSRESGKEAAGNVGAGVKNTGSHGELVGTLCARDFKGVGNQYVSEGKLVVSKAYSFDSLSSNSMKSSNPHSGCREVDLAKTLDTSIPCPSKNQGGIGVVAFAQNTRNEVRYIGGDGQIAGALAANPGMKQTTYLAFNSRQDPVSGDVFGALDTCSPQAQVIAGTQNDAFRDATNNLAPTLRSGSGGGVVNQAVATLTAVRRLTPIECERLQGFPDGHTAIPWRNKPAEDCPDGHRYKALGNSMAVPVMRWLGERINAFLP